MRRSVVLRWWLSPAGRGFLPGYDGSLVPGRTLFVGPISATAQDPSLTAAAPSASLRSRGGKATTPLNIDERVTYGPRESFSSLKV